MKKLLLSLLVIAFSVATYSVNAAIVINEIMVNPDMVNDADGEWIELYNTGFEDVDINGWVIKDDGGNEHEIDNNGSLIIESKGYLVLARNGNMTENGGVDVDYEYDDFTLSNDGEDEVILLDENDDVIDLVYYNDDTFPMDEPGVAMELINPDLDNNVPGSWGEAITQYGLGDYGTPGERNSIYEEPDYDCIYLNGEGRVRMELMGNALINGTGTIRVRDYEEIEMEGNWTSDNVGDWLILTGSGNIFVENWASNMRLKIDGTGNIDMNGFYELRTKGNGFKRIGCD